MVGFNTLGIRYRNNKVSQLSQPDIEELALILINRYNSD